jgi:hypothetical protein
MNGLYRGDIFCLVRIDGIGRDSGPQRHHQPLSWMLGWAWLAIFMTAIACHGGTPVSSVTPNEKTRIHIKDLRAFARLYGVVRWFHPSDTAAATDWNQFAIEGVRRIVDLSESRSLRATLKELFAPIAPTVQFAGPGEQFSPEPAWRPAPDPALELVSWQHKGFGDSTLVTVYASKRRHRVRLEPVAGALFASLSQTLDATPFRGMRVRLRGKLRVSSRGRGQLWLRIDRSTGRGFFANMQENPVISTKWESAEIVGDVAVDATRIAFGMLKHGNGATWYDDIQLDVRMSDGTWKPIEIRDSGFESPDVLANWTPGTIRGQAASIEGWNADLDSANPASGSMSLRIQRATKVTTDELFDDMPRPGETVDIDLGDGLRARVPLVLYSKDGLTLGDHNSKIKNFETNSNISTRTGFDVVAGVADVIVVWNVLQHFWPYWDVVKLDWNAELDTALADALDDQASSEHLITLQRLTAATPDAHIRTTCSSEHGSLDSPFLVEVIDDQIVVTTTAVRELSRGDVIESIDGRSAMAHLQAAEALVSGSPQWRRHQASMRFSTGTAGSQLTLGILRDGRIVTVNIDRSTTAHEEFSHPAIDRLDDGVYYVDLSRASSKDIDAIWDRLATAPGVVFDMRRPPNSNREVLSHLLMKPDESKAWLAIPRIIRPNHMPGSVLSWETSGWNIPVLQPHISGRVAFTTGPAAVSYAESLLSFVEYYRLGAIVGSTTAGTNGNLAEVTAPSGCITTFSGLRVTKHDGSRLHLVGIPPTIPASRTIAGVVAGRDEVLEKALAYVRGGISR